MRKLLFFLIIITIAIVAPVLYSNYIFNEDSQPDVASLRPVQRFSQERVVVSDSVVVGAPLIIFNSDSAEVRE